MKFKLLILSILTLAVASCRPTTNPNEWVVSTATCWNTMTVSKAGDVYPRTFGTCGRLIVLPATEMAADFKTQTKFQNRVAATINVTYNWRITEPTAFIHSAKSITSSATDQDHKIDPNTMEAIENSIVDKMLIDVIREYTPTLPAGSDELDIEKELGKRISDRFTDRGVTFSGMSVNVNFSPQIEEALDIISALKFYEANGQVELGKEVIKQKAGAANITTGSASAPIAVAQEK